MEPNTIGVSNRNLVFVDLISLETGRDRGEHRWLRLVLSSTWTISATVAVNAVSMLPYSAFLHPFLAPVVASLATARKPRSRQGATESTPPQTTHE